MKKLLSFILVLAALLALAAAAFAATEWELDPRAEIDGNTARLTCGPELHIKSDEYCAERERFNLRGICGSWETGPVTVRLFRVVVSDYTLKKHTDLSFLKTDLQLNKEAAVVSLQVQYTNNSEEDLYVCPSQALFSADDGAPLQRDLYLSTGSLSPVRFMSPGETALDVLAFVSYDFEAKDLDAFNFSIPAPVRADLTPVAEPLRLRIELLHAS